MYIIITKLHYICVYVYTRILCSWFRRINFVKMSILSELICRYNTIPIKISAGIFFIEIDKLILKFTWKCKGVKITKTTLKNKNEIG